MKKTPSAQADRAFSITYLEIDALPLAVSSRIKADRNTVAGSERRGYDE